jgi:uncharacterized protein YkwD
MAIAQRHVADGGGAPSRACRISRLRLARPRLILVRRVLIRGMQSQAAPPLSEGFPMRAGSHFTTDWKALLFFDEDVIRFDNICAALRKLAPPETGRIGTDDLTGAAAPAPIGPVVSDPLGAAAADDAAEVHDTPDEAEAILLEAFELRVLELTNEFRAENGLAPLLNSPTLNAAADDWSRQMAEGDFFAHSTPSQVEDHGYEWQHWGENIAGGQLTPEAVVQAWIDSPGHRANLLNESFEEIGIGYHHLPDDTGDVNYRHYWTQVFGAEADMLV